MTVPKEASREIIEESDFTDSSIPTSASLPDEARLWKNTKSKTLIPPNRKQGSKRASFQLLILRQTIIHKKYIGPKMGKVNVLKGINFEG